MPASFSDGWSWCNRCQALFNGMPGAPGACPAGGVHDGSASWDYFALFVDGDMTSPNHQIGWRTCKNWRVLFYGPWAASSSCPAGAHHSLSGSPTLAVQFDDKSSPSSQKGWRWCKNCQGLFYGPNAANAPCPAGAGRLHDKSASARYALPYFGVPFIGTYANGAELRVLGSNYTLGGQVDVFTKFSNDKLFHSERVTAIHNQAAPGGWITAGTKSVATAHPQIYNGYVQAYDRSTKKRSPRLPITISVPIDPNG